MHNFTEVHSSFAASDCDSALFAKRLVFLRGSVTLLQHAWATASRGPVKRTCAPKNDTHSTAPNNHHACHLDVQTQQKQLGSWSPFLAGSNSWLLPEQFRVTTLARVLSGGDVESCRHKARQHVANLQFAVGCWWAGGRGEGWWSGVGWWVGGEWGVEWSGVCV